MPSSKTTYGKTVGDWEGLLAAVAEHAQVMPEVEDLRAQLEQHVGRAKTLKAQKDSAAALRQGLTQQLNAELVLGREIAMRIRGIAKARIGPKAESIVQFGITPLRPRIRRAKGVELPPPSPPIGPEEVRPQTKGGDPPVH